MTSSMLKITVISIASKQKIRFESLQQSQKLVIIGRLTCTQNKTQRVFQAGFQMGVQVHHKQGGFVDIPPQDRPSTPWFSSVCLLDHFSLPAAMIVSARHSCPSKSSPQHMIVDSALSKNPLIFQAMHPLHSLNRHRLDRLQKISSI